MDRIQQRPNNNKAEHQDNTSHAKPLHASQAHFFFPLPFPLPLAPFLAAFSTASRMAWMRACCSTGLAGTENMEPAPPAVQGRSPGAGSGTLNEAGPGGGAFPPLPPLPPFAEPPDLAEPAEAGRLPPFPDAAVAGREAAAAAASAMNAAEGAGGGAAREIDTGTSTRSTAAAETDKPRSANTRRTRSASRAFTSANRRCSTGTADSTAMWSATGSTSPVMSVM